MSDIDQTELENAKRGNMTSLSRLVRLHTKPVVDKALADFVLPENEGKRATEKNPFRRGPGFNLTEQGRIFKTDPALAARLASAAGTKIA